MIVGEKLWETYLITILSSESIGMNTNYCQCLKITVLLIAVIAGLFLKLALFNIYNQYLYSNMVKLK